MSAEDISLAEQRDELKLIGIERAAHVANIRRAGRLAEADLADTRLPRLRAAYQTIDKLAKGQGQ